MAIERNLFFLDGNAYEIQGTMNFVTNLYNMADDWLFPEWRFEAIMSVLIDFKYLAIVDADTMIPDVHEDYLITMNNFMRKYGIVSHRVESYIEQLGNDYMNVAHWTHDLLISDLGDIEMEECIEDDPTAMDIDDDDVRDGAVALLGGVMGRYMTLGDIDSYHEDDLTVTDEDDMDLS